jgi:gliding motility-associated-like protein
LKNEKGQYPAISFFIIQLCYVLNILKNITLFFAILFYATPVIAQLCPKDSNFYSITYTGTESNYIDDAIVTSDNEIVTLGHYSAFGSFVSKFTAQGTNIWSNEYKPNYPYINWVQFPWYNNTSMQGIIPSSNSTFYVYGSSYEHGKSINNVEEPPAHWVGVLIHIDKFGKNIKGLYFGNWRTNYKITSVIEIPNGNLIVYLASLFAPYISKVVCVNQAGDILWGAPLQTVSLYEEVNNEIPVICQLKNGNIAVARVMVRNIADTLQYPFQPPIILPAPLNYFHLFELDGKSGKLVWETSYQCPTLSYSNVANTFTPGLKNIIQLPDGNLSLLADMYLPIDNERFYQNKVYSRRAVNFITDPDGFLQKFIAYRPPNSSCSLESVKQVDGTGERLLLAKDSTNQQLLLFKINDNGQIIWNKSYKNTNTTNSSKAVALPKQNGKGFFIMQSDASSTFNFHAAITNAIGNNPCSQLSASVIAEDAKWPWLVQKVNLFPNLLNIDFRYSPFLITQNTYPLSQTTNCEYQYSCCKDVIDSINQKNISLCPGENYTLPDNTKVKDSGTYYGTFKTQRGCDSILFYNIKILKPPSDLNTSPDTCLNNASTIQLRATDGYDSYLWNNTSLSDPFYSVYTPGTYTVKVQNKCGTKIDSILVYDNCDFTVYFPNAFTPNKDNVNDILKVPNQNKNKLLKLRVYNRYGQLIFQTTKLEEGWDGTFKGLPQPTGVYMYFLEMEGLSGKKVNQKGTVVLIR